MPKKEDEDLENSTKCQIYNNDYADGDVKLRYHFHITDILHIEIVLSKLN